MPANVDPFDIWSPVHVAAGLGLGAVGVRRGTAYVLILLTEVLERILENLGLLGVESRGNILADFVLGIGAYELARGFR